MGTVTENEINIAIISKLPQNYEEQHMMDKESAPSGASVDGSLSQRQEGLQSKRTEAAAEALVVTNRGSTATCKLFEKQGHIAYICRSSGEKRIRRPTESASTPESGGTEMKTPSAKRTNMHRRQASTATTNK